MAFLFKLETADGAPADPPMLDTAVPNWHRCAQLALGRRDSVRVVLHGPDPDGTPLAYFSLPGPPSPRYHAFMIVTVAKAAVARVHRVVVTDEVYDPNEIVVDVPYLPGY